MDPSKWVRAGPKGVGPSEPGPGPGACSAAERGMRRAALKRESLTRTVVSSSAAMDTAIDMYYTLRDMRKRQARSRGTQHPLQLHAVSA